MQTFFIALAIFLVAIMLMALGTILAKKPLRGSCGGLGALRNLLGLPPCESCQADPEKLSDTCARARRERKRRDSQTMDV